MKNKFPKIVTAVVFLILAIAFVFKFGGPPMLRAYIENGIGGCNKIPILCMEPKELVVHYKLDREFIQGLVPYKFPRMEICAPKGFSVVQETIKRPYYKKRPEKNKAVIYVLHQEKYFFVNLYPQVKSRGISDDYEFMRRVMYGRVDKIMDITDAFFVIMKSIFTPDLGDQHLVRMAVFTIPDKKGFINYNVTGPDHYFDCTFFNSKEGFFKVYIKDKGGALDLDKALAIISTAQELN